MYRNEEHYADPTFAAAYARIKKDMAKNNGDTYMPWVYIASPLRGDLERNIEKAKDYSRFAIKKNTVRCVRIYISRSSSVTGTRSSAESECCLACRC